MDDMPLSWMEFSYCTWNICDSIWLKTLWQCKLEMTFCFDIQIIQIHNPPHACYISQPNLVTFPLFGTLHHQNSTTHEIKHFKEMPYSTWFSRLYQAFRFMSKDDKTLPFQSLRQVLVIRSLQTSLIKMSNFNDVEIMRLFVSYKFLLVTNFCEKCKTTHFLRVGVCYPRLLWAK